jgi:serpin B
MVSLGITVTLLAILVLISGCSGPPGPNPPETPIPTVLTTPTATPAVLNATASDAEKSAVEANNQFAFDLYSKLRGDPEKVKSNLFFSPFSISSALAITCEGARGVTAHEIRSVFHFPIDDVSRRQGFQEISAGINQAKDGYTLSTANALWAERTYRFLPDYVQTVQRYYGANATNLNFITNPEGSRTTINRWVEDRTNNKILNLIPSGAIDPLTRLVITNAVYFKGMWLKQFNVNYTRKEEFRIAPNNTVEVPMMMMGGEHAVFGYYEAESLQVLRMPYAHKTGKGLSMLILLPKGDDLVAVEDRLDWQRISELSGAIRDQRVNVFFPKFTLETGYSLSGTLGAMGMPSVFEPEAADLSGMDGTRNLFITEIFHKAFVAVNEEGTEAAAATAAVVGIMAATEPPVPEFRADHPFIILIRDEDTGTILFLGRVINPNG